MESNNNNLNLNIEEDISNINEFSAEIDVYYKIKELLTYNNRYIKNITTFKY